jgi:hypothetical protein
MIVQEHGASCLGLGNVGFDRGKEVLAKTSAHHVETSYARALTLKVVSMLRTSPAMSDSEKSTLAFHNWDKNAKRSCLAVKRWRISCA